MGPSPNNPVLRDLIGFAIKDRDFDGIRMRASQGGPAWHIELLEAIASLDPSRFDSGLLSDFAWEIARSGGAGDLPIFSASTAASNVLTQAISRGHQLPMIRMLIEAGARVESEDELGRTPMTVSAFSGNQVALCFLIAHDADVDQPDAKGIRPIQHAVANDQTGAARILLSHHADVFAASGSTPSAHRMIESRSECPQGLRDLLVMNARARTEKSGQLLSTGQPGGFHLDVSP